jgi:CRP-like cAMP-binding protein
MSHEFTILVNRINIFAQRGIKERLALFLLILNETYKHPGQFAEEAEITLNRNDLAGYTGTSVENLVRTLKVFKENGYIKTSGKSIFIEDFEALYALTGI